MLNMVDSLTEKQIKEYVLTGKCPFCGKSGFNSISAHTSTRHGVKADELREMAGLGRAARLTSEELHDKISNERKNAPSDRQKQIKLAMQKGIELPSQIKIASYERTAVRESIVARANRFKNDFNERMKQYRHLPKNFSKSTQKAMTDRIQKAAANFKQNNPEKYKEQRLNASQRSHTKLSKLAAEKRKNNPQFCTICGKEIVWPIGKKVLKTCSEECLIELRKRNSKSNAYFNRGPAPKLCKNCGKEFIPRPNQVACSDECRHTLMSRAAKESAEWKIKRAVNARILKLKDAPVKKCKVAGCNDPYHSKGFCNKHYRQYLNTLPERKCKVPNCKNSIIAKGFCSTHYYQYCIQKKEAAN